MANKTTSTVHQNDGEAKELVVDARFITRSYNRDGKDVEFVSFELIEPFNGEDFCDVPLKAKWDKYNEKNILVRPDRVFGWMGYYAKKALKSASEVRVKVTIKPVTYKSKRSNDMVTYPAMFAEPTFVELEDEKPVEVVVKGAMQNNTFVLLASKALGIKFTAKDNADTEESD